MGDKRALTEALGVGKELELEGIKFYSEAAKGLEDEKGKGILEFLAREEEGHLSFIVGLEAAAVAAGMVPGQEEEEYPRFVEWLGKPGLSPKGMKDSPMRKDLAILKEARRAEVRSIEVLIAAEKRHLKWVEFMRDYVLTHGCWYEMKK